MPIAVVIRLIAKTITRMVNTIARIRIHGTRVDRAFTIIAIPSADHPPVSVRIHLNGFRRSITVVILSVTDLESPEGCGRVRVIAVALADQLAVLIKVRLVGGDSAVAVVVLPVTELLRLRVDHGIRVIAVALASHPSVFVFVGLPPGGGAIAVGVLPVADFLCLWVDRGIRVVTVGSPARLVIEAVDVVVPAVAYRVRRGEVDRTVIRVGVERIPDEGLAAHRVGCAHLIRVGIETAVSGQPALVRRAIDYRVDHGLTAVGDADPVARGAVLEVEIVGDIWDLRHQVSPDQQTFPGTKGYARNRVDPVGEVRPAPLDLPPGEVDLFFGGVVKDYVFIPPVGPGGIVEELVHENPGYGGSAGRFLLVGQTLVVVVGAAVFAEALAVAVLDIRTRRDQNKVTVLASIDPGLDGRLVGWDMDRGGKGWICREEKEHKSKTRNEADGPLHGLTCFLDRARIGQLKFFVQVYHVC